LTWLDLHSGNAIRSKVQQHCNATLVRDASWLQHHELTDGIKTGTGSTSIRITPEASPSSNWFPARSSPSTEKNTCRTNSCATFTGVSVLDMQISKWLRSNHCAVGNSANSPFIRRRSRLGIIRQPLNPTADSEIILNHTLQLRRRQLLQPPHRTSTPNRRGILCRALLMRDTALGAYQEISFRTCDERCFGILKRV
jgi:hypothetical protein